MTAEPSGHTGRLGRAASEITGCDAVALVEGSIVLAAEPAFAEAVGVSEERVVGFSLERHLVMAHRRGPSALVQDAVEAGGRPSAPIAFGGRAGPTRVVQLEVHDLRDSATVRSVVLVARTPAAGPEARLPLVESLVLSHLTIDPSVDTRLWSIAALVEWALPGLQCSIGVADEDVRHRSAPSLPESVLALLSRLESAGLLDGAIDRRRMDVTLDIREALSFQAHAHPGALLPAASRWLLPVLRVDDGSVMALIDIFGPPGTRPTADQQRALARVGQLVHAAVERWHVERLASRHWYHDHLTGLINRAGIEQAVGRRLHVSGGSDRAAVFFVGLDDFQRVNDALGHAAGDRVLVQVARRIEELARSDDDIGRFGGDEFVVITSVEDESDARSRADGLRLELEKIIADWGAGVAVAAGIGVAVATPTSTGQTLLRDADAAVHVAKREGGNRTVLFEPDLRADVLARAEMERALRRGIARREFEVHYQPIVEADTSRLVGAEALVRWRRDDELLQPGEFVPAAEDSGLIADVGLSVLAEALGVTADLRRMHPGYTVAINLAAPQLTPELVPVIVRELEQAGLDPLGLSVEITERSLLLAGVDSVVRALSDLGIRIVVDDFGTGYSNLDYLRRFAVARTLKLDSSFTADLEGPSPTGQAIIGAGILLGHGLGMDVVVEGVETEVQFDLVRELGADFVQGYFISPPLPEADLRAHLAQTHHRLASGGG